MSEFLTGPSQPSSPPDSGPEFEWGDPAPVFESPRPAAADKVNGEDHDVLPPIRTGRVFSRSFVMLLGAVALVGVTVIGAFGLNRDGDKKTITGSVELFDASGDGIGGTLSNCYGEGGYDDIDSGTQVMVKNGDGKILATTTLQAGSGETASDVLAGGVETTTTYDGYGSSYMSTVVRCTFPFEVEVPGGEKFYSVTVGSNGHRGTLTYSKDDMEQKDWKIDVSLG